MIRVLLAASLTLTLVACSHAGNEPHRDRRAELAVEHPLNGTWQQAGKESSDANTITFDTVPLDRYWQVRGGTYAGDLWRGDGRGEVEFAWDGFNNWHHQEPQHGYAGTAEVTYNTDIVYDTEDQWHRIHTDYCSYSVSDDHAQVTFSEGCVLMRGTYTKAM